MTVVIVCGGRSYGRVPSGLPADVQERAEAVACLERARLARVLDEAVMRLDLREISVGDATGADALAASWAERRAVPFKVWPADWMQHGSRAGPIRNRAMIEGSGATIVIAFPGSKGTRDCCRQGEKTGLRVIRVDWQ